MKKYLLAGLVAVAFAVVGVQSVSAAGFDFDFGRALFGGGSGAFTSCGYGGNCAYAAFLRHFAELYHHNQLCTLTPREVGFLAAFYNVTQGTVQVGSISVPVNIVGGHGLTMLILRFILRIIGGGPLHCQLIEFNHHFYFLR